MGKHTGDQAPHSQTGGSRVGALLGLAVGITVTLVAWGLLVSLAIDFGREARAGQTQAWIFLGLASLGATACLFTTLVLAARGLGVLRTPRAPAPAPRSPGGRRAAR